MIYEVTKTKVYHLFINDDEVAQFTVSEEHERVLASTSDSVLKFLGVDKHFCLGVVNKYDFNCYKHVDVLYCLENPKEYDDDLIDFLERYFPKYYEKIEREADEKNLDVRDYLCENNEYVYILCTAYYEGGILNE